MPIANQAELWQNPPPDLLLEVGEVHVWRVRMDDWYSRLDDLRSSLSSTERARAERLVFERDQARFTVARGLLRYLLGKYLGLKPSEICFETGERGKPFISNYMNPNIVTFNLSHSHDVCLIAIGRSRIIGVDVEKIRTDFEPLELATRYFAAQECIELQALPEDARSLGFFLGWTRKEAYVKARGDGLQIPLDEFSVTLDPDSQAVLRSSDSDRWQISTLSPAVDYVGAMVIERPVRSVTYWNLR